MKISDFTLPFKPLKIINCEGLTKEEYFKIRDLFKEQDVTFNNNLDLHSYMNLEIVKINKLLETLNNEDSLLLNYLKNDKDILKDGIVIDYSYCDCQSFSITNNYNYEKSKTTEVVSKIENILKDIGQADNKDDWNENINADSIKQCMFEYIIYRLYLGTNPDKKLIRLFFKLLNIPRKIIIPKYYIDNVVKNYDKIISFNNFNLFPYFEETW